MWLNKIMLMLSSCASRVEVIGLLPLGFRDDGEGRCLCSYRTSVINSHVYNMYVVVSMLSLCGFCLAYVQVQSKQNVYANREHSISGYRRPVVHTRIVKCKSSNT